MLKMAWRNLWRNRGRSLIVISAVAFSLGLMLVSYGMTLDRRVKFMEAAVRTAGGNILVHADGYWGAQTSDLQIADGTAVLDRIRAVPGVEHAVPRVIVNGLLTSTRGAEGLQLVGIDPDVEALVYDYSRHLVDGAYFADDGTTPLVLGAGVVDHLDADLGDRLVLTATAPDGEVTRALFRLSGVIRTGSQALDDSFGLTTLEGARNALGMDTQLTQIGVLVADDETRYQVKRAVVRAVDASASGLEVLTWDEAIPDLLGFVEIDDRFGAIYAFIIFLVVAFGIANTLLMMVMERIRELGMLNAIGMSGRRIRWLVLTETACMTAVAVAAGVTIGFSLHLLMAKYGIDMTAMTGSDFEISGVSMNDTVIRSQFDPVRWSVATLLVVGLIFASALYPAWRASRLDPVEAMRTFQ